MKTLRLSLILLVVPLALASGCANEPLPHLTVAQKVAAAQLAVDAACVGVAALQQGGTIAPDDAAKVTAACTAARDTLAVLSAGLPPAVAAAPASAASAP